MIGAAGSITVVELIKKSKLNFYISFVVKLNRTLVLTMLISLFDLKVI